MLTYHLYILHFDRPLAHARHYIGITAKLQRRMRRHKQGIGARLTQVLVLQGIGWTIGALHWGAMSAAEAREKEKCIKRQAKAKLYCHICAGAAAYRIPGMTATDRETAERWLRQCNALPERTDSDARL